VTIAYAAICLITQPIDYKLAVALGQSSNVFRRKSSHLGYPHTPPHGGDRHFLKKGFCRNALAVVHPFAAVPDAVELAQ
jgi:hypothetical protein